MSHLTTNNLGLSCGHKDNLQFSVNQKFCAGVTGLAWWSSWKKWKISAPSYLTGLLWEKQEEEGLRDDMLTTLNCLQKYRWNTNKWNFQITLRISVLNLHMVVLNNSHFSWWMAHLKFASLVPAPVTFLLYETLPFSYISWGAGVWALGVGPQIFYPRVS